MAKVSQYVAKKPDANGLIDYSSDENSVWAELYARQTNIVATRACQEFIDGLERLDLPRDHVPQCQKVSDSLGALTGWRVKPVAALIGHDEFFSLLAQKTFPAASFIRRREELDYLQEPDIFHELFGHTPLLTDPRFAVYSEAFGHAGVGANRAQQIALLRLYWFSTEFGLIRQANGELRIYGSGILSSKAETPYALESDIPKHQAFDPIEVLRTPYRIDIMQPLYFVIDDFDQLFDLAQQDLLALVDEASSLPMHDPLF
ncbi:MAG: phenylalanine 4-monooxygenase [Gammaproteobacteria bacterium]|nr:phenylalanine 4-monooxygenase [Gammaproteobacteria bacterium]